MGTSAMRYIIIILIVHRVLASFDRSVTGYWVLAHAGIPVVWLQRFLCVLYLC